MKVYIGPYKAHFICSIHEKYMDKKYGGGTYDNKTSMDKFIERIDDIIQWIYNKSINKISSMIPRKINVRIDKYDTFNVDDTIALIVLPLLIQFKEDTHGAPSIPDEDVPESLKCSTEDPEECPKYFDRWDYVLGEMIWAFQCKVDDNLEDYDVLEDYDDKRMKNGFLLFGKYYSSLWD